MRWEIDMKSGLRAGGAEKEILIPNVNHLFRKENRMPTEPIREFIPRTIDSPEIAGILNHLASLIEEVVNYSSHVSNWCVGKIKEGDENIVPILMFRNIFELIDSISVLVRNSSIEPCNILLRSLFESFLNFQYLFETDFKTRAMDFLLFNRHKEILSLRRFNPKDELFAKYEVMKAKDIIIKDLPSRSVPDIEEQIKSIERIFDLPTYKESAAEYERFKSNNKKHKPPKYWYSLHDGPRDVYQLAERLGFPAQYEILYKSWSELVHGTDIMKEKFVMVSPGVGSFVQLRFPSGVPFVSLMAIVFGLSTIRTISNVYIPEKVKDNADWYNREIKDSYLNIMKIKIIGI
jgi:hypothetical protein